MVVFSVQWSLFLNWSSVLCSDVAEEVVSGWSLRDPKRVVCSINPPQFHPATPLTIKGDRVESLGSRGLGVVSDGFFLWDRIVRNCSPLNPSIYVSFGGSNPSVVKPVWLEVPTVLCPLCQGVRFGDLGLNVTPVQGVA